MNMNERKRYLISGKCLFKKMDVKEMEQYDMFFMELKESIEKEIGRKLTEREENRLYFLVLGIINKHNEYDDRYHRYLLNLIFKWGGKYE